MFSPAMFKCLEQCQKKFEYRYIKSITTPSNSDFFERGKKIHALAGYYLQNFDITNLEKSLSKDELNMWNELKSSKYFSMKVLGVEYQLSCKFDSFWIGGRLDAFVQQGEDFYILDYKTGGVSDSPDYDFQTIIYLLAANEYLKQKNIPHKSLNFVYIDLLNKNNIIINFTPKFEEKSINILKQSFKNLELMNLSQKIGFNTKNCHNCEFKKLCDKINL